MTPRAAWASLPVWAAWADLGRACSHICRQLGGWTATGGPRLAHLSGSWLALDGATVTRLKVSHPPMGCLGLLHS